MNLDFTKKLGLWIYKIKVGTQKIDSSKLNIFGIIIVFFLIKDKERRSHFFEKTFLLANISIDIALDIHFFILSNIEIDIVNCYIHWKLYTIVKVFLTTRQIK